jgi:hypothetical protein
MADKFKYPLTKQFVSWSKRGEEEQKAVIRELFEIDPYILRKLRETITAVGNEPINPAR